MSQAPARLALPPFGPLLGAAYDRAVMMVIQSWRLTALLTVIGIVIISLPGMANSTFPNVLLFIWGFFAMANALRFVFDPAYKMSNLTAGHMFGAQLITGICVALLNIVGFVALLRAGVQNDLSWLFAIPGVVVSMWLYTRWSCGAAIGARGTPSTQALAASWRLTASAFWPTLFIQVATFVAGLVLGLAIGETARLILNSTHASGPLESWISTAAAGLVLISQIYVTQATALAVCMWLKTLETAQPAESGLA
jgi:hypothetical protein